MITGRALVTRATDKIGRAVALSLAESGFDVALQIDGDEASETDDLLAQISSKGRKAAVFELSLLDPDNVATLIDQARDALAGDITVLVNNAAEYAQDGMNSATADSFDAHIAANLKAPFLLTKSMAAQKLPAGDDGTGEPTPSGLIVNIIGQQVGKATTAHLTSSMAAAGLVALTRSSALELAPGVRVNAIAMDHSVREVRELQSQTVDPWLATRPFEPPNPQEIVEALTFFLKTPVVTGQVLNVEGRKKFV